jgi:hypothetical protein
VRKLSAEKGVKQELPIVIDLVSDCESDSESDSESDDDEVQQPVVIVCSDSEDDERECPTFAELKDEICSPLTPPDHQTPQLPTSPLAPPSPNDPNDLRAQLIEKVNELRNLNLPGHPLDELIEKLGEQIFFSYDQGWGNGKLVSSKGSGTLGMMGIRPKDISSDLWSEPGSLRRREGP